jgi:hypothetical protein
MIRQWIFNDYSMTRITQSSLFTTLMSLLSTPPMSHRKGMSLCSGCSMSCDFHPCLSQYNLDFGAYSHQQRALIFARLVECYYMRFFYTLRTLQTLGTLWISHHCTFALAASDAIFMPLWHLAFRLQRRLLWGFRP